MKSLDRRSFLRGGLALGLAALAVATGARPLFAAEAGGALVAIGGGTEDAQLIKEVLELAKGSASRVAIVNTASSDPARSGPAYQRFFSGLGVTQAQVVPLQTRDQAYEPAVLDALGRADLIYFTGGNQIKLAQAIADTPAHGALLAAWQRGAVVAGTSAGAMVWGPRFLAAGTSTGALKGEARSDLDLRPGLGIAPSVLVDTHFSRESRLGRLLVATAQSPGLLGIGVDERTAAVITADGVRALGVGRVTVLDMAQSRRPSRPGPTFSIREVAMHLLGAGETLRFQRDAAERAPMLPARGRLSKAMPAMWLQGREAPHPGIPLLSSRSGRLPEEVLVLAGDGASASLARWKAVLAQRGVTHVRVLAASQLVGDTLSRYLATPGGLLLVDDPQRSLAKALGGDQGALVRQAAAQMPMAVAGPAVTIPGETTMKLGSTSGELIPGLRLAPGLITSPDIWAEGALDRLTVDALLAGGAIGVGLAGDNGAAIENGALRAEGDSPVLVLETHRVSLANPTVPSARDLMLQVLAPGEDWPL